MINLIQELVKKEFIDKQRAIALEHEVKQSGKREEEIILEKGIIEEKELFDLKSEKLGIVLREAATEKAPLEVLELIPEETAKYYSMIPLSKKGGYLEVGMIYPEDLKSQEALKFLSRQGKFNYKVFLITKKSFDTLLKQYKTLKREVGVALEKLETELGEARPKGGAKPTIEFERMAEEAPVTKIVAVILKHAVEGKASDIHIEPTKERLRIRFRLTGSLHASIFLPLDIYPAVVARIKILSRLKIDETRIPQDGRFSIKVDGKDIDFRVSTFPTSLGEKVAIRVLDPTTGLKSFEELGLDGINLEKIKEAVSKPYGMILSTGPTGSGKTTTLYSILQVLNNEGVNIVTLEDPVEYFFEGVNQSQVKPEIGYDFPMGLRHILRQDPDIIMVGEIRDEETANLATHAALTGHIVLSTLHTSNAFGVIPRLLDLGIQPYLIPSALRLMIGQRLVKRLCDDCKKKVEPSQEIKEFLEKTLKEIPEQAKKHLKIKEVAVWEAPGCPKCSNSGFTGRIALFEVLVMTTSLANLILKDPNEEKIMLEAKSQGMITMQQDGVLKVIKGETTIEEVLRVTEEK